MPDCASRRINSLSAIAAACSQSAALLNTSLDGTVGIDDCSPTSSAVWASHPLGVMALMGGDITANQRFGSRLYHLSSAAWQASQRLRAVPHLQIDWGKISREHCSQLNFGIVGCRVGVGSLLRDGILLGSAGSLFVLDGGDVPSRPIGGEVGNGNADTDRLPRRWRGASRSS
ncbi:hypothetical protein C8J57DRAFT_1507667 [Mycena rebaudengoi]|nr:hypothetical protein C8J57DRAFT_1507667 [Mycena rebaudengoi]